MATTKHPKTTASSTATCKPRPTFLWTKAHILKLIELVKDSPQLWDPKHPDYLNKNKDDIWQHIAKDFKAASLKQVKFRFHVLKLTYYKFNDSKRIPFDKSDMATWEYNEPLKFLPLNKNIAAQKKSDVNVALKGNMKSKIHTISEYSREIYKMNSNSNKFWNDDRIFKLIDCIKSAPILWDHCHPDRKDRCKKEKTYERIAKQIGDEANSTKIQKKFRVLQIEFRANLRKKLRDNNCIITWRFFNALKFLANERDAEDEEFIQRSDTEMAKSYTNDASLLVDTNNDDDDDDDNINIFWNHNRIFKLIDCIKSSPILWDHCHPDRKDRFKKEKTFKRIAKQIGGEANAKDIEKKFRVLQTQFRANLRKKLGDNNCIITWRFFNALKFLASEPDAEDEEFIQRSDTEMTKSCTNDASLVDTDNDDVDDINIFWNHNRIFKLIDCIKTSPILWDHCHPDRKDRCKKEKTFERIAKQIGGEANSTKIQKKFRVLQIEFRANLRKKLRDKNCIITWKFFNALKFLAREPDTDKDDDHDKNKNAKNKSKDLLKDIADESVLNKLEFSKEPKKSPIWETETYPILDYINDEHNALDEHDSIDFEIADNSNNALDEHDSTDVNCDKLNDGENETDTKKDECTTFGEYIANEMRKMKGHHKLIELSFKSKVVRAVLEANDAMKKGW